MRTLAGRDWMARIMGDPSSDATGIYAPATWIGLTSDDTAEDETRTELPGEVTTGTLSRKQGVYAHTDGTDTYTLTHTFTSDQIIEINKCGVFTAPSGGTMAFERMLNGVASLQVDDQMRVTEVVDLSPGS